MEVQFTSTNVIVTILPFIVAIALMPYYMRKAKLKESGQLAIAEQRKARNQHILLYNNIFTRKSYRQIVNGYAALMCYDVDQLRMESVSLYKKAILSSGLIPLFIAISTRDFLFTAVSFIFAAVYYEKSTSKVIDKQVKTMNSELTYTVQSIADTYNLTHDITQAVQTCERASCLQIPIVKLYEMLMAENKRDALEEYKRSTPVRLLSTLASTCYIFSEEGDTETEEGSSFVQKLSQMRKEGDSKVNDLTATAITFSSLDTMALTGLIAAPIFNLFLLSQIPGTAAYIKGLYGYVVMTIIILFTAVGVYVINMLKRPSVVNQVDKMEIIDVLSKEKKIRNIVRDIIPKSVKEQVKWKKRIAEAISSKDLYYIYTMKLVIGTVALIAGIIVVSISTISAKNYLWNYYGSMSITSSTEMTETVEYQLKQVDKQYLEAEVKMTDEETRNLVKSKLPGLSSLEIEEQVKRLNSKRDMYEGIGFQWWYVLLISVFGLVGWFSPEIMLALRKKLVVYEATEDVMQLQSLMLTLQTTKMDVLHCLYWLRDESTIHKAPLRYACIEYPSDPELALQRLKDSVQSKDLKRLVAKLEKAMYDLTIADAFKDINQDKQQALITHEMLSKQMLESKKQFARFFATTPLNLTIYFGFMGPIFILGLQQLMAAFAGL